jgi:HSP20 family molecular chaperone IbpA
MSEINRNKLKLIYGLLKINQRLISSIFDEYTNGITSSEYPYVDVITTDGLVQVFVELPGFSLNDFNVYQYENLIVIEGRLKNHFNVENIRFIQVERKYNYFRKIINLPFSNMINKQAVLKDGVLYLEFVN